MDNWNTTNIGQSSMVLHRGGQAASWEDVRAVPTPAGTDSWMPIPHDRVVSEVTDTLSNLGMAVKESAFATYKDGQRFFGLLGLDVKVGDGSYGVVVGLRNSHDKSFPVGLVVGSRVFVCDNLAFSSEIQVTRRHTSRVMADLPRLIVTACGKINETAVVQESRFGHYKETWFTDQQAHDILVPAIDVGAIAPAALPLVLQEWRCPKHPEFVVDGKSAWRLWNGFTEVYKAYAVARLPRRTIALQGLFDVYTRFDASKAVDAAVDHAVANLAQAV